MGLTVVVNGVTNTEEGNNQGSERRARRVLAVEEPALDAGNASSGAALGKLAVEVDERLEASTRTARLHFQMDSILVSNNCGPLLVFDHVQRAWGWQP